MTSDDIDNYIIPAIKNLFRLSESKKGWARYLKTGKRYQMKIQVEGKLVARIFGHIKETDKAHLEMLKAESPSQYQLLTGYYANPRATYKVLAADHGLSVGTVRSRMHRAKLKMIRWREAHENAAEGDTDREALSALLRAGAGKSEEVEQG